MSELEPRHKRPPKPATLAMGQLTTMQQILWILWNIGTLGWPYMHKTMLAKAMCEALVMHDRMYQPAPYPMPAETRERGYIA